MHIVWDFVVVLLRILYGKHFVITPSRFFAKQCSLVFAAHAPLHMQKMFNRALSGFLTFRLLCTASSSLWFVLSARRTDGWLVGTPVSSSMCSLSGAATYELLPTKPLESRLDSTSFLASQRRDETVSTKVDVSLDRHQDRMSLIFEFLFPHA